VKHILNFSRKAEKERSPLQVDLLVKETLKLLRASIPTTITIQQDLAVNIGNILADATQIHQVVMNLCSNAAQAMDEEGGILRVELAKVDINAEDLKTEPNLKPGPYVQLTVQDTGTGINERYLDRIFDPYFTTKDVGKGSGLGLAVVIGIVKRHEGMVKVKSKLGEGTTFTVFFPIINEKAPLSTEDNSPLPIGIEKILMVDDEESIVDLTQKHAERLGYRVTTQTDSKAALELFRAQPDAFDLIITDQTMPGLTGENLANEVMKIRPDIPIIICTGYSSQMDAERASAVGFKAFIMKPVEKRELANTIRQVLDASAGK
jgi:CheY-like chemotaxis protein